MSDMEDRFNTPGEGLKAPIAKPYGPLQQDVDVTNESIEVVSRRVLQKWDYLWGISTNPEADASWRHLKNSLKVVEDSIASDMDVFKAEIAGLQLSRNQINLLPSTLENITAAGDIYDKIIALDANLRRLNSLLTEVRRRLHPPTPR